MGLSVLVRHQGKGQILVKADSRDEYRRPEGGEMSTCKSDSFQKHIENINRVIEQETAKIRRQTVLNYIADIIGLDDAELAVDIMREFQS